MEKDVGKEVKLSLLLVGLYFLLVIGFYLWNFYGFGISRSAGDWGVLGDFFGGMLNPVVSLVALYFLIRAYVTQKKELKETRDALESSANTQMRLAELQANQFELSSRALRAQIISAKIQSLHSEISFKLSEAGRIAREIEIDRASAGDFASFLPPNKKMTEQRQTLLDSVEVIRTDIQRLSHDLDLLLNN